jgi:hypothetical protein
VELFAVESLDRMSHQYPDLYEIIDGQCNRWWVMKMVIFFLVAARISSP